MIIDEEAYLAHYGVARRSGRYPWGSGGEQTGNHTDFLGYVASLRKQGVSDVDIARGMKMTTTELRALNSIAKNEQKQARIIQAQTLKEKGLSNVAIGEKMGLNESSVRSLLAPGAKDKADVLQTTAAVLKDQVEQKKYLDVGSGVEYHLGVSTTTLNNALAVLKEEGYGVHPTKIKQLGTDHETDLKVLVPPGVTQKEVWQNKGLIQQVSVFSDDGGRTQYGIMKPLEIHPDRVDVKYAEQGGTQADGVIFVRPGVKDVSLGGAGYAQVRVSVGPGHYLKGMAIYKDDLPNGVDLQFNTNKSDTGNKLDAMKKITDDPDNPYGSSIKRQLIVKKPDGTQVLTSAMNIVHEEGNWADWSKTISTQMLSKQSPRLAKTQLDTTFERAKEEYAALSKLTNPTVKKLLLEKFGDETDSSAVHLEAAGFPRQGWHAILPVSSLSPNQVYAPNFRDGERVVLIRFPHAGTFEIPELTVNNNHPESKKLLGSARDAIGIHHSVAERLSGADFDGDTVLVIPNNDGRVRSSPALEGLKNFDPRGKYKAYDGMKTIDGGVFNGSTGKVDYGNKKPSSRGKGIEMGQVSNLITDMTLRAAPASEMARAVRHSMVVIDAEKHHLNYKQSALDNNIGELKAKYQGKSTSGASTLISRATAEARVLARKPRPAAEGGAIDKTTGERVFVPTGEVNYRTGAPKLVKSTRLAETKDAHTLSSGTRIETIYAEHSNKLKALANEARKSSVNTPPSKYSPSARKVYDTEVKALDAQLTRALRNAPLERQAHILGNTVVKAKRDADPNMDQATLKKVKGQVLTEMRVRTGAKKTQITITPRQWEAIQAGAVSHSKLTRILANTDIDNIRELATPRVDTVMTPTRTNRAKSMLSSGYTRAEIASALGVSISTVDAATKVAE